MILVHNYILINNHKNLGLKINRLKYLHKLLENISKEQKSIFLLDIV